MSARGLAVLALWAVILGACPSVSLSQAGEEDSSGRERHEIWAWGLNNAGQLGVVDLDTRAEPTLVSVVQGKEVTDLAVGGSDKKESHVLALLHSSKLYSTGDNSHGQLGLGDSLDREGLTPVPRVFSRDFVSVASGEAHSVALTSDGRVFVWGSNAHGQLGLASQTGTTIPDELKDGIFGADHGGGGRKVVGVACGARHSMAWFDDGDLYAWGDNSFGQLGTGNNKAVPGFAKVKLALEPALEGSPIKSISSGGFHNLLLTREGKVYSWGKNDYGQLGLGKSGAAVVSKPSPVKGLGDGLQVTKVTAGQGFSMILGSDGEVVAFGDNSSNQLGPGAGYPHQKEPREMRTDVRFKDLSCGQLHCIAASAEGAVFIWGTDSYGQLGLGSSVRSQAVKKPERVRGIGGIQRVFASATGSYALSSKGELYAWGKNNAGQLGLRATKNSKSEPEVVVKVSDSVQVKSISAGGHAFQYEAHSGVIMSNREVYTWGWNIFAQLGNGDAEVRQGIPRLVPWLGRLNLTSIVCGQFSTAAVTEAGELYMWGSNEAGQLGRGDFSASTSDPIKIPIAGEVKSVSIGYGHVLAVTMDGKVFSWGKNFYGQLGVGDHRDKSTPEAVSHLEGETIVEVSAGQYHSLALTKTGVVYAWGYNRDYELGLNDNMDRVLPQDIPTLKNRKVAQISAGSYHNLALAEDGSLLSWGLNNYGQLGRNADKYGKWPGLVSITDHQGGRKLKGKKIAAGTWHSLAIAENNQVYAWGRCHFGQVGSKCDKSGSGVQTIPVRVIELEDKRVVDIAAGAAHSVAVTA